METGRALSAPPLDCNAMNEDSPGSYKRRLAESCSPHTIPYSPRSPPSCIPTSPRPIPYPMNSFTNHPNYCSHPQSSFHMEPAARTPQNYSGMPMYTPNHNIYETSGVSLSQLQNFALSSSSDSPSSHNSGSTHPSPLSVSSPSSSRPRTLVGMPKPMLSTKGMVCVHNYDPNYGADNIPIHVRVDFNTHVPHGSNMELCIAFNGIPLPTSFSHLANPRGGLTGTGDIQLSALVPLASDGITTAKVSVQVIDGSNLLDVAEFGCFVYESSQPNPVISSSPPRSKRRREEDSDEPIRRSQRSSFSTRSAYTPQVTSVRRLSTASSTSPHPLFIRTSQIHPGYYGNLDVPKARVVVGGGLESLGNPRTWTAIELGAGRRLIKLRRCTEGSTLHLDFSALSQVDYRENGVAISCIYRPMTQDACFTSVDIIFLLEVVIGTTLSVDEKNRIRRNLEKFKPKTVSKNKRDPEGLFSRIMGFPNPRPRNIEKDVKVFDWKDLGSALEKIITKYSYLGTDVVPKIEPVAMDSLLPMDSSPSPTPYFPATHLDVVPDNFIPAPTTPSFNPPSQPLTRSISPYYDSHHAVAYPIQLIQPNFQPPSVSTRVSDVSEQTYEIYYPQSQKALHPISVLGLEFMDGPISSSTDSSSQSDFKTLYESDTGEILKETIGLGQSGTGSNGSSPSSIAPATIAETFSDIYTSADNYYLHSYGNNEITYDPWLPSSEYPGGVGTDLETYFATSYNAQEPTNKMPNNLDFEALWAELEHTLPPSSYENTIDPRLL